MCCFGVLLAFRRGISLYIIYANSVAFQKSKAMFLPNVWSWLFTNDL